MKTKQFNKYTVLGKIAVVDISTKKHPKSSMRIDLDQWLKLLDMGIGRVSHNGQYAQSRLNGVAQQIHKLITPHFKRNVDHINRNRLDNRLSNLRDATYGENNRNQSLRKDNTSGICGISKREGKRRTTWRAMIWADGTNRTIGTFDTVEEAIAARAAANVRYGFSANHGKVRT